METDKMMPIDDLKTDDPFDQLFTRHSDVVNNITHDMKRNRFDPAFPIIFWKQKGKNIILDGHQRLEAAKDAGIKEVPVEEKFFESEEEAVKYCLHNQRDRRNLTDADILNVVMWCDSLSEDWGGDRKSSNFENSNLEKQDSRKAIADDYGFSRDKVSYARKVMRDEKLHKKVSKNLMSLHSAYKSILMKEKKEEEEKRVEDLLIEKVKLKDFPDNKKFRNVSSWRNRKVDDLFKQFQKLYKREIDLCRIHYDINYIKTGRDAEKNTEALLKQEYVKDFLESKYVHRFLFILKELNYPFKNVKSLPKPELPKKERHTPMFNLAKVHEVGFTSHAEWTQLNNEMQEMAARELYEQEQNRP